MIPLRFLPLFLALTATSYAAPAPPPPETNDRSPASVFDPTYRLAPLAEVEAYAKSNKHLPNAPSNEDFDEGGLDLAQTNRILLRKIEELTLHVIRQEKRIQAMEERLRP